MVSASPGRGSTMFGSTSTVGRERIIESRTKVT
jgi:hypothetical protein